MVRVISFEKALEQGESHQSIQWLIDWHRNAIEAIERSKKPSAKLERAADRHRDTIIELRRLQGLIGKAAAVAKAA